MNPIFRGKQILAPIARHQFDDLDEKYKIVAGLLGLTLCPIVTQDTIDRGRAIQEEIGLGFIPYLDKSIGVLEKKGLVLMAPQQKRKEKWFPYEKNPVGMLYKSLVRENATGILVPKSTSE